MAERRPSAARTVSGNFRVAEVYGFVVSVAPSGQTAVALDRTLFHRQESLHKTLMIFWGNRKIKMR